jgi:hypothetical protein
MVNNWLSVTHRRCLFMGGVDKSFLSTEEQGLLII